MSSINYKSQKNGKYKYKVTEEKTKYLLVAVQTYSQDGFKDKISFYLGSKNTALLIVIIVFGVIIGIILLIVGIIYLLRIIERCERRKSSKRKRKRLQQEEDKQRSTQNEQVKDQQQNDNQNQVEQKNDQNKTDNQQQQIMRIKKLILHKVKLKNCILQKIFKLIIKFLLLIVYKFSILNNIVIYFLFFIRL
jgi:hypothetical protein